MNGKDVDGYTVIQTSPDGSLRPVNVPAKMWSRVAKYVKSGTMKGIAYAALKLIDAGLDENCTDDEIRNILRKGDETEMTNGETGKVKLHFEHVLVRGERKHKFSFENVKKYDELPVEYVGGVPCMWVGRDGSLKYMSRVTTIIYSGHDGDTIDADTMQKITSVAKASAERLKEINKRIHDDEENWVGIVETLVV